MSVDQSPEILSYLSEMNEELRRLRTEVATLRTQPPMPPASRSLYGVDEVANMLGKSTYTVREWCRNGQVNAVKRVEKRGGSALWAIPPGEITRYRDHGLLSMDMNRNNRN